MRTPRKASCAASASWPPSTQSASAPAVRQAEHKLPVIPEPLGLVSLGRSAKRADPVATMGFATLMVLLTLAVMVLFVIDTPWVPG